MEYLFKRKKIYQIEKSENPGRQVNQIFQPGVVDQKTFPGWENRSQMKEGGRYQRNDGKMKDGKEIGGLKIKAGDDIGSEGETYH